MTSSCRCRGSRCLPALGAVLATFAVAAAPPQPPAPAASEPGLTTQTVRLRDIGGQAAIDMRGVDYSVWMPLSVRLDESVVGARLKLGYTFSPALLPELSQLKVMIDDQPLATIVAQKNALGSPQRAEIELDPRYFVDYVKLRLQFIGHYTTDCEFPSHTSLWASVAGDSTLELVTRRLALRNDLSLLPAPFFDARDARRVELPFVFASAPSLATLRSAGILASWFGALAAYRGANFPVVLDAAPKRHAVVLATNDERPAALALPKVDAPTLAVASLPGDPTTKLLLVLGRDAAQLEQAALGLVLGQAALTGERAEVRQVKLPAPRAAYDAPALVKTGGVVRVGDLVAGPEELQARGGAANPIRVNLRLPADIFTWEARGMPIDLRFRYTPPREGGTAGLAVNINDRFVEGFRLGSGGGSGARSLLSFGAAGSTLATRNLTVPAFELGSSNQLQFLFDLPAPEERRCASTLAAGGQAAIDPDSTLDLSHIEHYAALPNLAFYANGGFPFTKYADLAQTALVLPDAPQAAEVQSALVALGAMGAATGTAATRFAVLPASRVREAGDRDLLVVAAGAYPPLLDAWGQTLPARLEAGRRAASLLGRLEDASAEWFSGAAPRVVPRDGWTDLQARGPLAAISAFESPLAAGRSVVVLNATDAAALPAAAEVLIDSGKVRQVRGDLVLVRGGSVESFRVGEIYHVGSLRWWRWLWFQVHTHPVLLAALGLVVGLLVALILFRLLRGMAARRLAARG